MDRPKQCPFCKFSVHFNKLEFADGECICGARYHWKSDTWTLYDEKTKERKEVKGDLWNENIL